MNKSYVNDLYMDGSKHVLLPYFILILTRKRSSLSIRLYVYLHICNGISIKLHSS